MKRKILLIMLSAITACSLLTACGSSESDKSDAGAAAETVEATEESSEVIGGDVSLDASPVEDESDVSSEGMADASAEMSSEETAEETVPEEKPETVKFVIIQDVRDKMFILSDASGKTLTIDSESESGYTGDMEVKSGDYETGKSGYYVLPYSNRLTLTDMDDKIVYVSAEYPYMVSAAVQGAAKVVLADDRSVTITGVDDTTVFTYRVWLPAKGVKKETPDEVLQGKGSGTIRLYWSGTKISVEQVTGSSAAVSDASFDEVEASNVATVDWRTACPWADKISKGTWSDGADLSNVEALKSGIMSAKFTPVSEIEEKSKTTKITFYDANGEKLGVMVFWQTGKHVQFDDKSFDYDDLGLE